MMTPQSDQRSPRENLNLLQTPDGLRGSAESEDKRAPVKHKHQVKRVPRPRRVLPTEPLAKEGPQDGPISAEAAKAAAQRALSALSLSAPDQVFAQFGLPANHPVSVVRDQTRILSKFLDEMLEGVSGRATPGFGFHAKPVEPILIEPLLERVNETLRVVNTVVYGAALDPLAIRSQEMAKDLKMQLLGFKAMLSDRVLLGGVPEDRLGQVIETSIGFQRAISDYMSDLASLSLGVAINRGAA